MLSCRSIERKLPSKGHKLIKEHVTAKTLQNTLNAWK